MSNKGELTVTRIAAKDKEGNPILDKKGNPKPPKMAFKTVVQLGKIKVPIITPGPAPMPERPKGALTAGKLVSYSKKLVNAVETTQERKQEHLKRVQEIMRIAREVERLSLKSGKKGSKLLLGIGR